MKNRLFAVMPLAAMLMPITAFAGVTETQNTDDGNETEVYYTQASHYSVVIPKTIYLDVEEKSAEYMVTVSGGISSDKQVDVTPSDLVDTADGINFYMEDVTKVGDKKPDVLATVTQEGTVWTWAEVQSTIMKKGNINAPELTPGRWKGVFQFNISLTDVVE